MVTRREDGPILAIIVSLIIGVFGGYGPPLSTIKSWHLEWFWRVCPGVRQHPPLHYDSLTCLSLRLGCPRHFFMRILLR